jgi:citrate synthase
MPNEPVLLSTEEVARRLGVKLATVYAYVSRGLLSSRRNADGKGSLFAEPDVDEFLAGRRRGPTPGIRTGITLIEDGGLYYRGRDACVLARTTTYEAVATLLWTGELAHVDLVAPPGLLELARAVLRPLPATARTTDRLRVIVAAAAAADPLRFDTSPTAVVATARAVLATMVTALPIASGELAASRKPAASAASREPAASLDPAASLEPATPLEPAASPIAAALWERLTPRPPTDHDRQVLNAALILVADHDIAASTLAARVAASTRAHPYAVVGAGLAALDGPLHGGASGLAHDLLAEALHHRDPVVAVAGRLRSDGHLPGFGHSLYPGGDPRARTLFDLLGDGPAQAAADRIAEAMRSRSGVHPTIDLALAAFTLQHGMPAEAGEAIFAVARTAGWLAHALEEYADRPSRFRPSGHYAGRAPQP